MPLSDVEERTGGTDETKNLGGFGDSGARGPRVVASFDGVGLHVDAQARADERHDDEQDSYGSDASAGGAHADQTGVWGLRADACRPGAEAHDSAHCAGAGARGSSSGHGGSNAACADAAHAGNAPCGARYEHGDGHGHGVASSRSADRCRSRGGAGNSDARRVSAADPVSLGDRGASARST